MGGVGENFLVAGNASIKNDFAVAFAFGSVAFASEDSAVFQRKDSLHSRSSVGIYRILSGIVVSAKDRTRARCGNLVDSKMSPLEHERNESFRPPHVFLIAAAQIRLQRLLLHGHSIKVTHRSC